MKIVVKKEITIGTLLRELVEKHAGGKPGVQGRDYYDKPGTRQLTDDCYEKIAEEFFQQIQGGSPPDNLRR